MLVVNKLLAAAADAKVVVFFWTILRITGRGGRGVTTHNGVTSRVDAKLKLTRRQDLSCQTQYHFEYLSFIRKDIFHFNIKQ